MPSSTFVTTVSSGTSIACDDRQRAPTENRMFSPVIKRKSGSARSCSGKMRPLTHSTEQSYAPLIATSSPVSSRSFLLRSERSMPDDTLPNISPHGVSSVSLCCRRLCYPHVVGQRHFPTAFNATKLIIMLTSRYHEQFQLKRLSMLLDTSMSRFLVRNIVVMSTVKCAWKHVSAYSETNFNFRVVTCRDHSSKRCSVLTTHPITLNRKSTVNSLWEKSIWVRISRATQFFKYSSNSTIFYSIFNSANVSENMCQYIPRQISIFESLQAGITHQRDARCHT